MTCWWSQCHWWCKVLFEECPSLGGHYDREWYWYWCLLRYWHCIGGGTIRHHSLARGKYLNCENREEQELWMRIRVINLNKVAAGLEDCRHNPHIPRSAGGRRWIKIFSHRPINWINLKTYGIFHIYLIQSTPPSMTKFNEERFLDRNVHLKAILGPKPEQLPWVYNL